MAIGKYEDDDRKMKNKEANKKIKKLGKKYFENICNKISNIHKLLIQCKL